MSDKSEKVTFLSCFKCGRIVRSTETECPRCGMKFGPGTLFECPFCAGLVWRSAEVCSTCKTDLFKFAKEIGDSLESFSMDGFVDEMIESTLDNMRGAAIKVACPSCGLMISGSEERCPRCEFKLKGAKVDCPVCGEKVLLADEKCWNCDTVFYEISELDEERATKQKQEIKAQMAEGPDEELLQIRAILASAKKDQEKAAVPDVEKEKPKKKPTKKNRKVLGKKKK